MESLEGWVKGRWSGRSDGTHVGDEGVKARMWWPGGGAYEVEGVWVSSSWRAFIESINSASRPPELEVDGEEEPNDLLLS